MVEVKKLFPAKLKKERIDRMMNIQ